MHGSQVLVQGPPGTGKTHTAAALLSHLLAQGQRVLVTAQTDRALQEVRAKLPEAVRSLAVAVVGTSRSDLADLKQAVNEISQRQEHHDASASRAKIKRLQSTIEELRADRKRLGQRLLEIRERDTQTHSHFGYEGTLSVLAQQSNEGGPRYEWLKSLEPDGDVCPVTDEAALEWLYSLRDQDFLRDRAETKLPPAAHDLPEPATFQELVDQVEHAESEAIRFQPYYGHPAFRGISELSQEARAELRQGLELIALAVDRLALLRASWAKDALADVRAGAWRIWVDRRNHIQSQIDLAEQHLAHIPPGISVRISEDSDEMLHLAETLRVYVATHGEPKLSPDGQPKIGLFSPAAIKQAQPLFHRVRVGGRVPTTVGALNALIGYIHGSRILAEADLSWPAVEIPTSDSVQMRVAWHRTQLDQLNQILELAQNLDRFSTWFIQHNVPQPDWSDLPKALELLEVVSASQAVERREQARRPLTQLDAHLATSVRLEPSNQTMQRIHEAVVERDGKSYESAFSRIQRLSGLRSKVERLAVTEQDLRVHAPALVKSICETVSDESWDTRLADLSGAWAWCALRRELGKEMARPVDINGIQRRIQAVEDRLRSIAAEIAAERAWARAIGPDRLSGSNRQHLIQYAQLVSRLGKGTGKYADLRRMEIRQTMDRCRPLVPVWIMPLYRITEQLDVTENMFDVVLVDEASQAGIEAMFLQYLAKRIVVIGDDKQVSPSAVGVDEEEIRSLADQYFDAADPAKAVWQDPKRSLFDEAKARFGGQLTLLEHRRCVPEIIGFSNQIAYEPEGVRLVPVRQYGSDRLEPIKTVYCPDGYEAGSSGSKVNRAEAEAIVSQLLSCLSDTAYDGKTFGVISLLGSAQARLIEHLLLNALSPKEWSARDLRCGDSASFQGSERDVIFLSLVTGPEDGGYARGARTRNEDLQRFNVAFSRAKDQVWLFHSVTLEQLRNEEDMRHQLLSYCLQRGKNTAAGLPAPVSETEREHPFDSLFEQRVFNRILERGYLVEPQVETNGYRIDLAVIGRNTRLAVECDGNFWHGPEQFQRDLGRQRDLERCGWRFFRIRESAYYLAPEMALKPLWKQLDQLEIAPVGAADECPLAGNSKASAQPDPESPEADTAATQDFGTRPGGPDSPEHVTPPTVQLPQTALAGAKDVAPLEPDRKDQQTLPLPVESDLTSVPSGRRAALEGNGTRPLKRTITDRRSAGGSSPQVGDGKRSGRAYTSAPRPQRAAKTPKLVDYQSFSGWAPSAISRDNPQTIAVLRSIVKAEGPVTGRRLKRAFLDAAGLPQDSAQHDRELNRALHTAVLTHRITAHSPLGESNLNAQTFTVGHQPATPRRLGPRRVLEIPPAEVAALLDLVDDGSGPPFGMQARVSGHRGKDPHTGHLGSLPESRPVATGAAGKPGQRGSRFRQRGSEGLRAGLVRGALRSGADRPRDRQTWLRRSRSPLGSLAAGQPRVHVPGRTRPPRPNGGTHHDPAAFPLPVPPCRS